MVAAESRIADAPDYVSIEKRCLARMMEIDQQALAEIVERNTSDREWLAALPEASRKLYPAQVQMIKDKTALIQMITKTGYYIPLDYRDPSAKVIDMAERQRHIRRLSDQLNQITEAHRNK